MKQQEEEEQHTKKSRCDGDSEEEEEDGGERGEDDYETQSDEDLQAYRRERQKRNRDNERYIVIHAPPKHAEHMQHLINSLPDFAAQAVGDFLEKRLPSATRDMKPTEFYNLFDTYHRSPGLTAHLLTTEDEESRHGYERLGYPLPEHRNLPEQQPGGQTPVRQDIQRTVQPVIADSLPITAGRRDDRFDNAAGSKDMEHCDN